MLVFADGQRFMDIRDTTRMYDADFIDGHFVNSNDVEKIVGSIVTNRVDEVLSPKNWECVYSNKTVVATNEFDVTPYVMNRIKFIKKDKINISDYNTDESTTITARGDNHNYSLLIERDVNGVTDEGDVILDLSYLIKEGRVYCNIATNEEGQVSIKQDRLPIIMRLEEPTKGFIICTLKSLDELPPMELKDLIKWSR